MKTMRVLLFWLFIFIEIHSPTITIDVVSNFTVNCYNESNSDRSTNYIGTQFHENLGQIKLNNVLYYGFIPDGIVGFGISEISFWINEVGLKRIRFEGTKEILPIGSNQMKHWTNYFLGDRGTFTNIRGYSCVSYLNFLPGITLKCGWIGVEPKFEFQLSENADAYNIQIYNLKNELEQTWTAIKSKINVHNTDARIKLYSRADALLYSTYVGGARGDYAQSIAVDSSGNTYVTGYTTSSDFPTVNAYNPHYSGEHGDIFIFKLNAAGNELLYSTFIGGSERDAGISIDIDSSGNAYVTGETASTDFPTVNAFDESLDGSSDCFVLKLNATGNGLLYSTYIGGILDDHGQDIILDEEENMVISGNTISIDFPIKNAYDITHNGDIDCFLLKLNSTGNNLEYSTYIGGSESDKVNSITVDELGNIFLAGHTESPDFPTVNAYDSSYNGGGRPRWFFGDCFVLKINSSGNELLYSTYVGGSDGPEIANSIVSDSQGNVYVTGWTESSDFPIIGAYDDSLNGSSDCFVFKLNATGEALTYSTYIGGNASENSGSISIEPLGHITICGRTDSSDFPTLNAYDETWNGEGDCFIVQLSPNGSSLEFATYIGGSLGDLGVDIVVHDSAIIYVLGSTKSPDFPTLNAFDDSYHGEYFCSFVLALCDMRDFDDDELTNYDEVQLGTNRYDNDTDDDSLDDYSEVHIYGTNPTTIDSDGDGMPDPWEILYNLDPLNKSDAAQDPDFDLLSNLEEFLASTNPHNFDTDGDSISDGWEIANNFDPLNAEIPLTEFLLYNMPLIIIIIGIIFFAPIIYNLNRYLQQYHRKKQEIEEAEHIRKTLEELDRANKEDESNSK